MRQFKFFNGFINDDIHVEYFNVRAIERELSDTLANEIMNEIDNEIIRHLTYHVNGRVTEDPSEYLNHWLRIGENRA